ncbi:MAG: PorT family protein [Bacteroidetes bacterium]|nr:PorT family protein [Bacteroidota bacterium]
MRIIFLLIALLSSTIILAQDLSIGYEIGLISSSNSDYNRLDIENRRNTDYFGVNFQKTMNQSISFGSGLQFLKQGYKHGTCYIVPDDVKNEVVGKLNYLVVPATINTHLGKSKRFIANFGIYGAVNIKAVQDIPDEIIGGCAIGYIDNLRRFTKRFGVGGILELGYEVYRHDKFQVNTLVKYYQGFSNTKKYPDPNVIVPWMAKYNSAIISVSLNYKIGI